VASSGGVLAVSGTGEDVDGVQLGEASLKVGSAALIASSTCTERRLDARWQRWASFTRRIA
jgi:hypothetical protein